MKRSLTIFAFVFLLAAVSAQAPEKMSYQAVVRDNTDELVTNHEVGMRISILQGAADGTEVYKEIYNPNPETNANGLVSIEIGAGIPLTGTFSAIDWSSGPYFIKTEIDPSGGTTYSITGTSQILSVPYALHANTAGAVLEETQTLGDVLTEGNDAGTMQIKNVGLPTDKHDATSKAYVDNAAPVRYEVGDYAQGGVVFWVDETGQHGLVAAYRDSGHSPIQWYNGTDTNTGAIGYRLFAGESNTILIIASQGPDLWDYAAGICIGYNNTYSDWYLPSAYELEVMFSNKAAIDATALANGGTAIAEDLYWSSTRYENGRARVVDFGSGSLIARMKSEANRVRPVRAF